MEWLKGLRKGYGRKLVSLHTWNGWIVLILALTGLILISGLWRGVLGEVRVWIKWAHIVVGIISIVPVVYYLLLAAKHWKQLRGKPWQRFNVLVILGLLLGWFGSGIVLWQFKAFGPANSNIALFVHDALTWVGLPYIIYHSITRLKWLKQPQRLSVKAPQEEETLHPAANPQAVYTRRAFIKWTIGAGLAVTLGPSFLQWLGRSLGGGTGNLEQLIENDANRMVPPPQPLPASAPPIGGGSQGRFRVYTVTPIPQFSNADWSFTIDGLVENKLHYDWERFVAMPRVAEVSDFHCVTGWSVYSNTWEGIPLKTLLAEAGVSDQARTVKFYSGDGVYTDSLTLEQVEEMDDVLVAVMHDGKPIPSDLGGPVKLIVPQMYAYKSVKWLNRIELIDGDHDGYWIVRGYAKDAWVTKS
ncbi:molybdopterin-dependent oxidoreductase [Paenibacillus sp. 1P07SE]|uniref:molybdopterin-dependent oxidoreductase n=1 Tax=Paenibacillus sp. 1P07SE TaxID=3132209 RepID=UPI0039A65A44